MTSWPFGQNLPRSATEYSQAVSVVNGIYPAASPTQISWAMREYLKRSTLDVNDLAASLMARWPGATANFEALMEQWERCGGVAHLDCGHIIVEDEGVHMGFDPTRVEQRLQAKRDEARRAGAEFTEIRDQVVFDVRADAFAEALQILRNEYAKAKADNEDTDHIDAGVLILVRGKTRVALPPSAVKQINQNETVPGGVYSCQVWLHDGVFYTVYLPFAELVQWLQHFV